VRVQLEAEEAARRGDSDEAHGVVTLFQSAIQSRGHTKVADAAGRLAGSVRDAGSFQASRAYRSSLKKGATRSVGSSYQADADADLRAMGRGQSTAAQRRMEQSFGAEKGEQRKSAPRLDRKRSERWWSPGPPPDQRARREHELARPACIVLATVTSSPAVTRRAASDPLRFDAAYFDRHYRGPHRAHSAREMAQLVRGVCGLSAWLGVRLRTVLDVGAGTGAWRGAVRRLLPEVRYRSIDVSPYACSRYGHERRDISRWRVRERFDLVVCHSVLQYLPDDAAERAIESMAAMCRGMLYLETITRADVEVLDRERTDMEMHLRSAGWYRSRIADAFEQVGAGLWAARNGPVRLYALERASR
jgi:SAM-dependent methyltransferase